jgi:hypothetical protein
MRFLVKVNIPVAAGNEAAKAGKLGTTIQAIVADLEARGCLFHRRQGSTDGLSFPRHAGRLTDSSDCRAVVPRVQREHRDTSSDGAG